MKESGTRRQVSFNVDEELYTEFKKRMLDDHTTPTAYLTRCIRERVERETVQFQVDSRLYRQFTQLAQSRGAEPEELLLRYIRQTVEQAGKEGTSWN